METIAAIATPPGQGAIALIRISGPQALQTADRIFQTGSGKKSAPKASTLPARTQHFGRLLDGDGTVDEVLLTLFRAPASFTGEDVVEICCHGGQLVTRRVYELVLRSGATPAGPGEFTRRAFLNGKMDLTQAESIMDLVLAQSDRALRAATRQLAGHLGERVRGLQSNLLDLLAHLEAYIDFPEEDISPDSGEILQARMQEVATELQRLLATAREGRLLREGIRTVLSGAPNAGKSSLLNRLLGFERALVSAIPGTTRDALEETILLQGWPLRLIDTAGLRDASDPLELLGMERARKHLEEADIILEIHDGTLPPADSAPPTDPRVLRILNKADLNIHPAWNSHEVVRLSCLTAAGLPDLEQALLQRIHSGLGPVDDAGEVAISARHADCVRKSLDLLQTARNALAERVPAEFVAEELRAALLAVGEIVGRTDTEDLLGRIFSTFCIGK